MTKLELIRNLKKIAAFDGNFTQLSGYIILKIKKDKRTMIFKIFFNKRSATLIAIIDTILYSYFPPNLEELLGVIKFWLDLN